VGFCVRANGLAASSRDGRTNKEWKQEDILLRLLMAKFELGKQKVPIHLYKTYALPILEFASPVFNPYLKKVV
jgi:hypothetical protein